MSNAWSLVRGGLKAGSLGSPSKDREDGRRARRSAPRVGWVSPDTRAEIATRLAAREDPAQIAASLGLQVSTVLRIENESWGYGL